MTAKSMLMRPHLTSFATPLGTES